MQIRVMKRGEVTKQKSMLIRGSAIVLSLLAVTVFIAILKLNPIEVFSAMIKGALGSAYRFEETIKMMVPLIITSLGIAIAFKMQFWNIGAEGQIIMGAFFASIIPMNFKTLPMPIMLIAMMVMGIIGGGLWALIPAFFKAKWGTNETIVTLMMNYVAFNWVNYLKNGPWKDPLSTNFPKFPTFVDAAILPEFLGVHIGWVIALVLVIILYFFMNHSKLGYEIAVLGESEETARYAGINISKTIVIAVMLSGGLCGLTGMIQASAISNSLSTEITNGVGYTAIIVTWLSSLSAPIIVVVSFLFSVLLLGCSYIQSNFGIPQSAAQIIQGLILLFVLGSEFFTKYKIILQKEEA